MLKKHASKKPKGVLLVIEGTDGSGKSTQAGLLKDRLEAEGYTVASYDFPRFDQPAGYFAKQYAKDNYGPQSNIGPYTGSLFYALDRYDAAQDIKDALDAGNIVVVNRYTGSNMAQQGMKFNNAEERRGFFIWLDNLEFMLLDLPRPDISFTLRVPAEIAKRLASEKCEVRKAELDELQKSVEVYDDLCRLFPKDYKQIDCVRGGELMTMENVHSLIWEQAKAILPKPSEVSTKKTKPNPYVAATETGLTITEKGKEFLDKIVTNTTGNVYGFKDTSTPTTVAAAMARLSRRGDDLRLTILDEFAQAENKDTALLQRVITAYGDDSVQQLVGQHIVVEGASNLLTKKLEWGRLAAYLEQSTRYIYFNRKDENGKYSYFTPPNLDANTKEIYETSMNSIFELYSEMLHRLSDHIQKHSNTPAEEQDAAWHSAIRAQACDAIRPVLPVATKSTVGIFASGQALESLITHLLSDELAEAQETGQKILAEARKTIPAFLERVDKPERGGAVIAYQATTKKAIQTLADNLLPVNHVANDAQPVTLTDVWPRNELDIVPDMLYEHSDMPLPAIREAVSSWPYEQKIQVMQTYVGERLNRRHKPGRALEKIHYSFDLLCDYGIFRDLQRHRMVDDLEWQTLTPRHGYEVPSLVDTAGLTELFERCFDVSLDLHSKLQANGYAREAQYATLLGHKMRWKVTYNAREAFHLHELRTSPQGHPGYRKLVQQMHEAVTNIHPLIAEGMKFVNHGEDPELTRLAAERYSQFKLQKLGGQQPTLDK